MAPKVISGFSNYIIYPDGKVWSMKRDRFLKGSSAGKGYLIVKMGKKREYVHRLVASAFLGSAKGKEVNHRDGDKLNNCVENLEWVTRKENMVHAQTTGKILKGEKLKHAKLSCQQVRRIKKLLLTGRKNQRQIAKLFGVHFVTINDIKAGRSWAHITELSNGTKAGNNIQREAPQTAGAHT